MNLSLNRNLSLNPSLNLGLETFKCHYHQCETATVPTEISNGYSLRSRVSLRKKFRHSKVVKLNDRSSGIDHYFI